ncbi:hypothetical protein, partial [Streptomyces sp. NRRL B-24572]|uniref:hypothetical protein n=1 Tax=Streptomyces sp. NRRL B-24572 TaxID=1962156 RepID=UPI001C500AD3
SAAPIRSRRVSYGLPCRDARVTVCPPGRPVSRRPRSRRHRRRPRTEVTRSEYEALSKQGQRIMFAIYVLLAGGGGAVTLVFGKLDDLAGRP